MGKTDNIYSEISVGTALSFFRTVANGHLKARSYTMDGTKVLASFDCTVTPEQINTLAECASTIILWHYGGDTECSSDISLYIGLADPNEITGVYQMLTVRVTEA